MKNIILITKVMFLYFYFIFYLIPLNGVGVNEAIFEIQQKVNNFLIYYGYDILNSDNSNYSKEVYAISTNKIITSIESSQYFKTIKNGKIVNFYGTGKVSEYKICGSEESKELCYNIEIELEGSNNDFFLINIFISGKFNLPISVIKSHVKGIYINSQEKVSLNVISQIIVTNKNNKIYIDGKSSIQEKINDKLYKKFINKKEIITTLSENEFEHDIKINESGKYYNSNITLLFNSIIDKK